MHKIIPAHPPLNLSTISAGLFTRNNTLYTRTTPKVLHIRDETLKASARSHLDLTHEFPESLYIWHWRCLTLNSLHSSSKRMTFQAGIHLLKLNIRHPLCVSYALCWWAVDVANVGDQVRKNIAKCVETWISTLKTNLFYFKRNLNKYLCNMFTCALWGLRWRWIRPAFLCIHCRYIFQRCFSSYRETNGHYEHLTADVTIIFDISLLHW